MCPNASSFPKYCRGGRLGQPLRNADEHDATSDDRDRDDPRASDAPAMRASVSRDAKLAWSRSRLMAFRTDSGTGRRDARSSGGAVTRITALLMR